MKPLISYNSTKSCRRLTDFGEKETLGFVLADSNGGLPYLDYDMPIEEAIDDINELIAAFSLSCYATIGTKKGCHVVFNKFCTWQEILQIMQYSKKVDPQFYMLKKEMGYSRIRVGKKYGEDDLKLLYVINPGNEPLHFKMKMLLEMLPNVQKD